MSPTRFVFASLTFSATILKTTFKSFIEAYKFRFLGKGVCVIVSCALLRVLQETVN